MNTRWNYTNRINRCVLSALLASAAVGSISRAGDADDWRAQRRIIDLHQHLNGTTQHLARAVHIMDRVGIGIAVNLSGGYVTHGMNKQSEFERTRGLAD